MTAELIALTEELHAANVMLGQVVARLDEADRRARRHRAGTAVLALCVLAIAVLFGLFYVDDQRDDELACLRGNATRTDIREAILETVRTVAAGNPDSDPDRLDAALMQIDESLRDRFPERKC